MKVPKMDIGADVVAYDSKGRLVLVVEVKNRRKTTTEWAVQMRRNLFVHSPIANARYFLLATPDRFYLWVDKQTPELVNPDYTIDPTPFLRPYFGAEQTSDYLTNIGFEMVVEAWLATLTWNSELPENKAEGNDWIVTSGLFDALKQGHLASEVTL